MASGWASERFAREERLSGLGHYLKEHNAEEEAALAEATAEAEFVRMALAKGLTIEDQEPDEPVDETGSAA